MNGVKKLIRFKALRCGLCSCGEQLTGLEVRGRIKGRHENVTTFDTYVSS